MWSAVLEVLMDFVADILIGTVDWQIQSEDTANDRQAMNAMQGGFGGGGGPKAGPGPLPGLCGFCGAPGPAVGRCAGCRKVLCEGCVREGARPGEVFCPECAPENDDQGGFGFF